MDCIDRSNIAQFVVGLAVLGRQLHATGVTETPLLGLEKGELTRYGKQGGKPPFATLCCPADVAVMLMSLPHACLFAVPQTSR